MSKIIKDETGYPIPEGALTYWNRKAEVLSQIAKLSVISNEIMLAIEKKDVMYAEISGPLLQCDFSNVINHIMMAIPHAVCPVCQGHKEAQVNAHCRMCFGRGMVSKLRWERAVPEEIKQIRKKGTKK